MYPLLGGMPKVACLLFSLRGSSGVPFRGGAGGRGPPGAGRTGKLKVVALALEGPALVGFSPTLGIELVVTIRGPMPGCAEPPERLEDTPFRVGDRFCACEWPYPSLGEMMPMPAPTMGISPDVGVSNSRSSPPWVGDSAELRRSRVAGDS